MEIHISKFYEFHWKYYEFIVKRTTTSYVGSSNFTKAGQNTNAEILVGIKNNSELNNAFDKQWKNSASISEFRLDMYVDIEIVSRGKGQLPKEIKCFLIKKKP
ncbi:MAG: hypothetical protein IPH46_16110 [Bacteroidetes bacterium]|nr:hypothetical protein [Bacteroidota bacterium]